MFNKVISDIKTHMKEPRNVVEYYAGVGAIGLALHDIADEIQAYEVVPVMVEAANKNAKDNAITNYRAYSVSAADSTTKILQDTDLLILDPPRKGLDEKLIKDVLGAKPKQIAYVACSHTTQARDYALLESEYEITYCAGYDFYPNTPHVESLLMLHLRT